jgi:hypothetical protein
VIETEYHLFTALEDKWLKAFDVDFDQEDLFAIPLCLPDIVERIKL